VRVTAATCGDRATIGFDGDHDDIIPHSHDNLKRTNSMTIQHPKLSGGKIGISRGDFAGDHFKVALDTVRCGVIAGAAGGLAEIAWVTLYAGATGANPAILARGVTTAAGVSAMLPAAPLASGIAVHMTLAVMLGVVLTVVWRTLTSYRSAPANPFPFMLAALVGVWAINFFLVLPIVSPAFVYLLPYPVSLISKMLFGLAAAEALRRQHAV
jgi:hypothetical protein